MSGPRVPCPVCGRWLAPGCRGLVPWHRRPDWIGAPLAYCPGSGALAPAADLFPDAPQADAIPAPGVQASLPLEG